MHTKLTIPERWKNLRVAEKRMSLQELSGATGIQNSTLGNYEKDENADMSLGNLLTLADFYQVSTEYLLQQKLSELNLSTHLFLINPSYSLSSSEVSMLLPICLRISCSNFGFFTNLRIISSTAALILSSFHCLL